MDDDVKSVGAYRTIEDALGHQPRRERHAKWQTLHDATDRVNVDRLAEERQSRDNEIKLRWVAGSNPAGIASPFVLRRKTLKTQRKFVPLATVLEC